MRTHTERPTHKPAWIAGVSLFLLAAVGAVAIFRAIPTSYANIPGEGASTQPRARTVWSDDSRTKDSQPPSPVKPGIPMRCPGCGVIASMRQIEQTRDAGGHDAVAVKAAGRASNPASAPADAMAGTRYESIVRFHDGSTTVFNEATPRAWRLGSRVMVIAGTGASVN